MHFGRLLCLALLFILVPTESSARDYRFASTRLGTTWYIFSATLYKIMAGEMPDGDRMEVFAKGGGIANPILVDLGKVDFGLANRCTAVWARDGHEVYKGKKHPDLRTLVGGLNRVPVSALVRADYVKKTGNDTLEKILAGDDPVRVIMKPKGSSVPVAADMILKAMGTSREDIVKKGGAILQVSPKQIPDALKNGQADLYFEVMLKGHPTVTQISQTMDVRFLSVPKSAQEKLSKIGLEGMTITKNWKGQHAPTEGVDLGTIIISHKRLPDDIAYLFTKTVCEERETLAKAHKAWANFKPEDAWRPELAGIPLHPGAARYYRERGWMKD